MGLENAIGPASQQSFNVGLARQTVQRWADGIDVAGTRAETIAKAVEQASRKAE